MDSLPLTQQLISKSPPTNLISTPPSTNHLESVFFSFRPTPYPAMPKSYYFYIYCLFLFHRLPGGGQSRQSCFPDSAHQRETFWTGAQDFVHRFSLLPHPFLSDALLPVVLARGFFANTILSKGNTKFIFLLYKNILKMKNSRKHPARSKPLELPGEGRQFTLFVNCPLTY